MSTFSKARVIPILLLKENGLVKTTCFKKPIYIGDPINSVRIFNEKEVDELVFLDIDATVENRGPNFGMLRDIAEEAFMPMAYGGGITKLCEIKEIFKIGFEKIILNSVIYKQPSLIKEAVQIFGSQSIVVCIDVRKNIFGNYKLYSRSGKTIQKFEILDYCIQLEKLGAGELIINSIDHEGTGKGYDIQLIKLISSSLNIPVVALGGASKLNHFKEVIELGGAQSVAAGSMFVFLGKHKAVLINYPERKVLNELFSN